MRHRRRQREEKVSRVTSESVDYNKVRRSCIEAMTNSLGRARAAYVGADTTGDCRAVGGHIKRRIEVSARNDFDYVELSIRGCELIDYVIATSRKNLRKTGRARVQIV